MTHLIFRWIGMLAWFFSSVAAINLGLRPFGFDFFTTEFMLLNMPQLIVPLHYVILVSGLISLALFVMSFTGHCSCNSGCK